MSCCFLNLQIISAVLIGLFTLLVVFYRRAGSLRPNRNGIMVVLGSGGHTGEMINMMRKFDFRQYTSIHFVTASTDLISKKKLLAVLQKESMLLDADKINWVEIPRSREVKQSMFSSIFSTVHAILKCFFALIRIRKIDVLLCNGPGICLPVVICVLVNKFLFIYRHTKVIYIESWCRVKSLSLTGKLLVRFVDKFIVQWEDLVESQSQHKNVQYLGQLV